MVWAEYLDVQANLACLESTVRFPICNPKRKWLLERCFSTNAIEIRKLNEARKQSAVPQTHTAWYVKYATKQNKQNSNFRFVD